jgi:hypothetical protein
MKGRGVSAKGIMMIITAALMGASMNAFGESIKLERAVVEFDFKNDGYYQTIPFIAMHNDLFFISDNFKHRILVFRFHKNLLEFCRAIGQPGQGPGDLMLPTDISVSADSLAVRDELGISFFGSDGVYKSRFTLLSKSTAMLYLKPDVYIATCDSRSPDLIQVYAESGKMSLSFQEKRALHPLRYDIHKGLSPDSVERIVFDGILRAEGSSLYYLSRRFGDFVKYGLSGKAIIKKELAPLLSDNERAKSEENRRMFIDDGFDLIKNNRMVPNLHLFSDAQILNGRLYLLIDGWDLSKKKMKSTIEFVEIDIGSWRILNTYFAETVTSRESAANFVLLDDDEKLTFLTRLRDPEDDDKICLFRPRQNKDQVAHKGLHP